MSQNPDLPDSSEQASGGNERPRVDRVVVFLLISMFISFVVSVIDFVLLQMMVIQIHWFVIGLLLLAIGSVTKILPRKKLVEAGLGSALNTAYLQVVKDQRLVTDGFYKYIRHPIYSGDIMQKYGWVIMLSSLYGLVFVTIGLCGYLYRIRREEEMLVEVFGEEYKEYQRNTKKLIPYIY